MVRGYLGTRIAVGSAALVAWLLVFSTGLLIETYEYRKVLAPRAFAEMETEATPKAAAANATLQPFAGSHVSAFLAATLCFTPTNLAILCALAALVGGCSSNILLESMSEADVNRLQSSQKQYLEEAPWTSMMRGFLVYLSVLAGLYFAVDDPFKDTTPSQYLRLAGTISLMSFLVGYDPSRIKKILRWDFEQRQSVTVEKKDGDVKVQVDQVLPVPEPSTNGEAADDGVAPAVVAAIATEKVVEVAAQPAVAAKPKKAK